jgi:hypothetical protein
MPPAAKTTANYVNSSLAKIEALDHGYDEAIMLNEQGNVCEGTGENLHRPRRRHPHPAGLRRHPRRHHP